MKRNRVPLHRSIVIVAFVHLGLIGCIIFFVKPVKKEGGQVTWLAAGSLTTPTTAAGEISSAPSQQEEPAVEEDQSAAMSAESKEDLTPEPLVPSQAEPMSNTPAIPPPAATSEITTATPTPVPAEPKKTPIASQATPKPSLKPPPKVKEAGKKKNSTPSTKKKVESPSAHQSSTATTSVKKSDRERGKALSFKSSTKSSIKKGTADRGREDLKKAFLSSKNGTGSDVKGAGNASGSQGNSINSGVVAGYHELIHDRFYSQWEQPTAIPTEHKHDFVCTLRLTIECDGAISNFSLAKPSGNPVMDESVLAAAARVKQIAPLPEGLNQNASYTVNINFELE